MNIGSWGLHEIHGDFQAQVMATKWVIEKLLISILKTSHVTHARREAYITIGKSEKFPLRYLYL